MVARELIGCALVHGVRDGMIVETEAYRGAEDGASHARFGRPGGRGTSRTAVMFGPGGIAYVYLCYGIHEMFNIVTGPDGEGQAVLIRAIAPRFGFPVGLADDASVGRGPGKVTTALGIDRRQNMRDLARGSLFVAALGHAPPPIAVGPRIGVDYAGTWADAPLRFWWEGHPSVSRSSAPARSSALGVRATPKT